MKHGSSNHKKDSRQHDRKCRLKSSQVTSAYFNHPSQGNSTNYYLILGLRDQRITRAQELCKSRGGRPGLPVPNHPTVSVDLKKDFNQQQRISSQLKKKKKKKKSLLNDTLALPYLKRENLENLEAE